MQEVKEKYQEVFDYILQEETDFQTRKIPLGSNWNWNMYEHIDKSFLLKNSQFTLGDNSTMKRPFKNIIIPIANVNYRSEGFDVKDIDLYVDNKDKFHLSFLSRKFHTRWAIKYSIDTTIDDSVESYFDYGLALLKNENNQRPVTIDLKDELAFCNQSDILAGPICLKHEYSIDELLDMKDKWFNDEVDRAILHATFSTQDENGQEIKQPNKSLQVYELHGVFPESWLGKEKLGEEWEDTGKYVRQFHVVTYYKDSNNNKKGITLFKGKVDNKFKALKRDKVSKRACGRGGIEELFHPQIWINYSEIHLQQMLEATSKVITKTTDKKLAQQNKFDLLKHNQIIYIEEGKTWEQMVVQPLNKVAFDSYINTWEQSGRTNGSASDPQLGLNPVSGTPLGTTQIVTSQGIGIHEYRRGKIATFWGEVYRDWIMEYIVNEINKGDEWLEELSIDELKEVAEKISIVYSNKRIKDIIINKGKTVTKEMQDTLLQTIKDTFIKNGRKKFIKIVKDEFKNIKFDVKFNIAGKQKNLYEVVNKLNAVFQAVFANPAILQQPNMGELFNNILESSGLSPLNFTSFVTPTVNRAIQSSVTPLNESVSSSITPNLINNTQNIQ